MKARLARRATTVLAGSLALVLLGGGTSHAAVSPATKALLTRVGILQGDLAPGFTARVGSQGESLSRATLDNCNYRFTTEARRVAKREVDIVDANGDETYAAGESVMYSTPAYAAQALVEWRASVARCRPLTWIRDDFRIDSQSNRVNRSLPLADHVDTNILIKPAGSKVWVRVLIIGQRRGAVITFIYVYTTPTPHRADVADLQFFAQRTGARLAAAVR